MNFNYTPSGVTPYKLELKFCAPVKIIVNVLHPYVISRKLFFSKHITFRVIKAGKF